jgi:hypothetical protein
MSRADRRPTAADLARELLCALDPVTFAAEKLGFTADFWQENFLRSSAPQMLVNVSRQAGKSTTAAVLALHTAVHRPGSLVLLVSPSLRQSGELFRKVKSFRQRLEPAPALTEDNALSCAFKNGSRVVSLPGDESTVRGFSAPRLVIEDEASRVDDALHRAVRPMLAVSQGGRLVLLSTPAGRQGHFWEAWSESGEAWSRIEVPATAVPRISPAFLAAERLALGQSWFDQEYRCQFLQASNQVFRPEDLARAFSNQIEPLFPTAVPAGDVVPLFARGGR